MSTQDFVPLDFNRVSQAAMLETSARLRRRIAKRRSVRDFSSEQIEMGVIEHCIMAAGSAPSGANRQPWHFVCVTDPEVKRAIRRAAESEERAFYEERAPEQWLEAIAPMGVSQQKPFLEEAPCLIVIFAEQYRQTQVGDREKNYYVMESVGIATGFLIAALHLSGLGTLTHTPSPMDFLGEILDRPSNERAFLILVVGLPKEDAVVPNLSRKPLGEIATFR